MDTRNIYICTYKGKILRGAKGGKITYRKKSKIITSGFSSETMESRRKYLKCGKKKNNKKYQKHQPRNLYALKLSFNSEG